MSGRGRGGKFNKAKRGGGKHFSRDLQPLDKDGNPVGMWRDPKEDPASEEDSSEEDDEESTEESEDDEADKADLTREQRKEQQRLKKQQAIAKKNQKVAEVGDMPTDSEEDSDEDDMPANPNHTQKARNQAKAVSGNIGEAPPAKKADNENLSRREREALAAQQAKERYQKLHAEGKTDEARADLARLKLIREQREAATAKKNAEKDEKDAQAASNKDKVDRETKLRDQALGASKGKKAKK